MTKNLWDAAQEVLRGKCIAKRSYLKKQEQSKINNLTLYLQQLKEEQTKLSQYKERNHKDQNRNT